MQMTERPCDYVWPDIVLKADRSLADQCQGCSRRGKPGMSLTPAVNFHKQRDGALRAECVDRRHEPTVVQAGKHQQPPYLGGVVLNSIQAQAA